MKTVKLSELANDTLVFPEDGHITTAETLKDIALDGGTVRNWYVGEKCIWTPNVQDMFEDYIENASGDMYEDADETMRDAMNPLVPQVQAILDAVKIPYYEPVSLIEIDIPSTK